MNQEEQGKKMGQLIARCWVDESFRQKLLADPAALLKVEGVDLPVDITVNIFENTHKVFSLVLPKQFLS
jgi:Nitrile hydratase, alpha chain